MDSAAGEHGVEDGVGKGGDWTGDDNDDLRTGVEGGAERVYTTICTLDNQRSGRSQ